MQKNYFIYQKPECNILINKMPIYFKEVEFNGEEKKGMIKFFSHHDYDEIWGPNAEMEINWESKERTKFFHAREVQDSIDMYNSIKITVVNKETVWLNSHEFTYWFGNRTQMIRKKYYPEIVIHGVFYCEISERQFNLHTKVIREHYEGYKPFIIEAYNTLVCH